MDLRKDGINIEDHVQLASGQIVQAEDLLVRSLEKRDQEREAWEEERDAWEEAAEEER